MSATVLHFDPFCPRHGRRSRPIEIPGLRCDCTENDEVSNKLMMLEVAYDGMCEANPIAPPHREAFAKVAAARGVPEQVFAEWAFGKGWR